MSRANRFEIYQLTPEGRAKLAQDQPLAESDLLLAGRVATFAEAITLVETIPAEYRFSNCMVDTQPDLPMAWGR